MRYKEKLILTDTEIETFKYSNDIIIGVKREKREKKYYKKPLTEKEKELKLIENRKRSASRTKSTIRRLIASNMYLSKFYTLTFDDYITNIDEANYLFNLFAKRWKNRHPFNKYICVPEIMPNSKKVHYHILTDMKYLPSEHLAKMWGNGFVKLKRIYSKKGLPYYMTKYLTKGDNVNKFFNKRRFFGSLNLNKPLVFYNEWVSNVLNPALNKFYEVFKCNYYVKFIGFCDYTKYFSDV